MLSKPYDASDTLVRRTFLDRIIRAATGGAATALAFHACSSPADAATQDNWRRCGKCNMIFYAGYRKSLCPAGRRHEARVGANYLLPYDVPGNANAQGAWRFCHRCESLFFDGYPAKGACPAKGGHSAAGYVFVLPHDVSARGYVEKNWRFCNKCHSMFYDGDSNKGSCAAGGAHVAQGFNFVLRFRGNLEGDTVQNPVRD
jgi:hypothetical protein